MNYEMSFKGLIQLIPIWSISMFAFMPLFLKVLNGNKELKIGVTIGIHFMGLLTSFFLFLLIGFNGREVAFLRFDVYGSGTCLLILMGALQSLSFLKSNSWIDKRQMTEILFLFSHGVAALLLFSLSRNLIGAFVSLEVASLVLYIIIAMSRKEYFSLEASIKYFILGSFASIIFLYGLSFIFGTVGSLNLDEIILQMNSSSQYNRFFFLGLVFILSGILFKIGIFPFQFYFPDVYQGALNPFASFMSTGMKAALILFFGKLILIPFFNQKENGEILVHGLEVLSVATVLFGNIMALNQKYIKRFIAYSSIAHSGYLLMAMVAFLHLLPEERNFSNIFFYLISYILSTGVIWGSIQYLEKESPQPTFSDLKGLFFKNPVCSSILILSVLNLAGLPPLFGFFSKILLFQPLVLSGSWWLLFWAVIGSAIGIYYYMNFVLCILSKKDLKNKSISIIKPQILFRFVLYISGFLFITGGFIFGFLFHNPI